MKGMALLSDGFMIYSTYRSKLPSPATADGAIFWYMLFVRSPLQFRMAGDDGMASLSDGFMIYSTYSSNLFRSPATADGAIFRDMLFVRSPMQFRMAGDDY
jgi:hypothetical protein